MFSLVVAHGTSLKMLMYQMNSSCVPSASLELVILLTWSFMAGTRWDSLGLGAVTYSVVCPFHVSRAHGSPKRPPALALRAVRENRCLG